MAATVPIPWLCTLLCGLAPTLALAFDAEPIRIRSAAPAKALVLSPTPMSSAFQHRWQLSASAQAASIFAQSEQYELDYYRLDLGTELLFRPHRRWRVGLQYHHGRAEDLRLDQTTLTFHKWFGLDQNGRLEVDKHRFLADLPQGTFSDFKGELLSDQAGLSLGYQWLDLDRHQLSSTVQAQYHDSPDWLRQGGRWDGSLQLDYRYQHRSYGLSLMVAASGQGADRILGAEARSLVWHGDIGYRYHFNPRHSLALHYLVSQGVVHDLGELAKPVHEAALGYRYNGGQWAWETVLLQNLLNADNSADFGLQARLRFQFD